MNRWLEASEARGGARPSPRLGVVCPRPNRQVPTDPFIPRTFFDPSPGSLDELARRYVEDPAALQRFERLLAPGAVLAHHLPAALIARALGRPLLCSLHSLWPSVQRSLPGPTPNAGRAALCEALLADAEAILVPTEAERSMLLAHAAPGAPAAALDRRLHVVPLVASPFLQRLVGRGDLARRRAAWRHRLVPEAAMDDIVFYAVGRLVPYKRPLEVVEAFLRVAARIPRAHLVWIGPATDPACARGVRATLDRASPDVRRRVRLAGPQRIEAGPLAGDVLIHASAYESWGRVLDEAFLFGRPAILHASPILAERAAVPPPPGSTSSRSLELDATDPRALDDALVRAATDATWRAECGAYHLHRGRRLRGDEPVRRLLSVWNRVEEANGGAPPFALPGP